VNQKELFEDCKSKSALPELPAADFFLSGINGESEMPCALQELFELSAYAFYAALYARMSELPMEREISRFIEKVFTAVSSIPDKRSPGARAAADKAASDRGDADVLAVLKISGKVLHEIHRLTGLLRFSENEGGVYIARCSPDFFILPALAEHFTLRFGETAWAIIDEKRKLCLCREKGGLAKLLPLPASFAAEEKANNFWEELWRLYHRSVTIDIRKNLKLQRQFMPERYHKYLTEMQS
jgi:hypothetical protein